MLIYKRIVRREKCAKTRTMNISGNLSKSSAFARAHPGKRVLSHRDHHSIDISVTATG